jgi:hypothetical protein
MTIDVYKIRQLIDAGKAQVRSAIASVGTEEGTDHGLIQTVAAQMFHGAQVAARYVYEQVLPSTADAENRDLMIDYRGLSFEKDATNACGLILVLGVAPEKTIPAGTEIEFPATSFADGVARTYVLLEDAFLVASTWSGKTVGAGSSEWKLRVYGVAGVRDMQPKDVFSIDGSGTIGRLNAIRRVNHEDMSIDMYAQTWDYPIVTDAIAHVSYASVVRAECKVAGKLGNCFDNSYATFADLDYTGARILEMGGGGDAVSAVDSDERVIRVLEDTVAGAPSLGNDQHLRELVLSCPTVDIDDAVVFSHARGPGTVDIVAIGRAGRIASSLQGSLRNDFYFGNFRRIGEVAAERIDAWINERDASGAYVRLSYFDDVKVRSVEYDWSGESFDKYDDPDFFRATSSLTMVVDPLTGYGPDCGAVVEYIPHTISTTKLYPVAAPDTVHSGFRVGHRVWVTLAKLGDRKPFVTFVTPIVAIPSDRKYVVVADVTGAFNATDGDGVPQLREWGSAGPLTQPVVDAVFDYFTNLGPGSYTNTPMGPGYMRGFRPTGVVIPLPGTSIDRWPDEGRRWAAGLRESELNARIIAIKGVREAVISRDLETIFDIDPIAMRTLALRGVKVIYGTLT